MNKNLENLKEIIRWIILFLFIIEVYIRPKFTYIEKIIYINIIIILGSILLYINLKNLKTNNK